MRGAWDDYYRDLVSRIEGLGVLVMREASLGHHTRPLRVDEFRGFAIADDMAPVIFVNHADAPGARLFTLIHELCHIWTGVSGISDGEESSAHRSETVCNAVAAEFLAAELEFPLDLPEWKERTKRSHSGPSYHTTRNAQLSKPFSCAVLSQAFNGHLALREAGELLGINPSKLRRFAEEVQL